MSLNIHEESAYIYEKKMFFPAHNNLYSTKLEISIQYNVTYAGI